MSTEGLINVCQAVKHGELRKLTNLKTGKQGIVVDVVGDKLSVQTGGATELWPYEDCE
ncbi:MAG: hypothetical protein RQ754_02740 [Desulfuromonadales bacterium]|jgi:hypothetical protein|nr:hypothetical protein [Desulfuromonadales bacterium]